MLWLLASFSLPIALAVFTDRLALFSQAWRSQLAANSTDAAPSNCQTLIADPNPPLNVRSSPGVAPDNKVATLPNGTNLSVTDEQEGWLRIDSPLQGWVYKELTVTSCLNSSELTTQSLFSSPAQRDDGAKLLAIATAQYQAGKLNGAIALMKTIPPGSVAHAPAKLLMPQWQRDWSRAEAEYYIAQTALREQRWQDVLQIVNSYPDIRFWRQKLAPIVQQAIQQQHAKAK